MISEIVKALGLKEKKNMTISAVISVTDGVVNSVTLNAEGSKDDKELVMKTFATTDSLSDGQKNLARAGGFPVNTEEFMGGPAMKAEKQPEESEPFRR